MTDRNQIWRWTKILIVLLILLPGYPLFLICVGFLLSRIGLDDIVFKAAFISHNLYYSVPAAVFGKGLFPSEEFGYLPTSAGTIVAAIFYAILAVALSFPLCWVFGKLKKRKMDN